MSLPPLPPVLFVINYMDDSYTAEQMQAYGHQVRAEALEDAQKATRPFGKTGAVIAAAIRSLK